MGAVRRFNVGMFLLVLLKASASHAQMANDTSFNIQTEWQPYFTGGAGWMYENVAFTGSASIFRTHLFGEARAVLMPLDAGHDANYHDLPWEVVLDNALITGYRLSGKAAYLTLGVGPAFTYGQLRGNIYQTTSADGFFTSIPIRNHNTIRLHDFGVTAEVRSGINVGDFFGIGARAFYTMNKQIKYVGIDLELSAGKYR